MQCLHRFDFFGDVFFDWDLLLAVVVGIVDILGDVGIVDTLGDVGIGDTLGDAGIGVILLDRSRL